MADKPREKAQFPELQKPNHGVQNRETETWRGHVRPFTSSPHHLVRACKATRQVAKAKIPQ